MMTLRYSATHRPDSLYNLVYRLGAMEAYNERLVKRIAVKGIAEAEGVATEGYVYLQGLNLSRAAAPTARVQFDKLDVIFLGFLLFAFVVDFLLLR